MGRIYNELSIDGSHNEGKVQNLNQNYSKGYYLCVGGLVGIVNKDAVIKNSYNIGDVLDGTKVGGIIAYAGGNIIIDKCYNTGNLSTNEKLSFSETSTCIGGIVGFSKGVFVLNSYNSGNITNNSPQKSGSPASGIIGHVGSGTNSCIINTYNIGDISSLFSSTGIIYTVGTSKVYNVYNAGKILGTATYKYGLADIRNNGDVSGEYMYYLNNVELGATKEDLGIVMEENAMKKDSFVKQLNENIKKINLTEINPTLSEYKLVNWKKGSNGYPVFQ